MFSDWMCRPNLFWIGYVNHNRICGLVCRPGQRSQVKYISFFVYWYLEGCVRIEFCEVLQRELLQCMVLILCASFNSYRTHKLKYIVFHIQQIMCYARKYTVQGTISLRLCSFMYNYFFFLTLSFISMNIVLQSQYVYFWW